MAKTTASGLAKQSLTIPLTGGIDRKTDALQLSAGQMYTCDNVVYTSEKQLSKRNGYQTVTSPGGLQGAPFAAVGCRDNLEPIVVGSGALNRFNTQTQLSTYIPTTTPGSFESTPITSSSHIGNNPTVPSNVTSVSDGSKYTLLCWHEPQGATATCFYGIQDLKTGSWIISPRVLNLAVNIPTGIAGSIYSGGYFLPQTFPWTSVGVTSPRAMYNGQYFFIMYESIVSNAYSKAELGRYNQVTSSNYISTFTADSTAGQSLTYYQNFRVQLQMVSVDLTNLQAQPVATSFLKTVTDATVRNFYYYPGQSSYGTLVSNPLPTSLANVGYDAIIANQQLTLAYTDLSAALIANGVTATVPNTLPIGMASYSVSGQTFTPIATGSLSGPYPYAPPGTYPVTSSTVPAITYSIYARVSIALGGPATTPYAVVSNGSMYVVNSALASTYRYDWPNLITDTTGLLNTAIWSSGRVAAFNPINDAVKKYYTIAYVAYNTSDSSVVTGTLSAPLSSFDVGILSRVFLYNGKLYMWLFSSGTNGGTVYRGQVLTELTLSTANVKYVARTAYQIAAFPNLGDQTVPSDIILTGNPGEYVCYLTQTTENVGTSPVNYFSTSTPSNTRASILNYGVISRSAFNFQDLSQIRIYNLPSGGNFISGPYPSYYDGQSVQDAGFATSPDFVSNAGSGQIALGTVQTTSNLNNISPGTYSYYALFVYTDAYGNKVRSSPSVAYTVYLSAGTGTNATYTFPPVYYNGVTNGYVEYYRTTLATPSESYFVGRASFGSSFTDALNDSAITGQANLYTYSGELCNDPPPPVYSMDFGETRAYLIPSDSRNQVWASKLYTPGHALEWSSNLIISEGGTKNGSFTAVKVLDTNVIVFKEDSIVYFNGTGPDNTGASGTFTSFQKLASDVGCIDPSSIVTVPNGLLFRSRRGIELLSRGLQVSYVGFPIEPIIRAMGAIQSAIVLPQYQQVRFASAVLTDPVLVYDYLSNRWSTFSNMSNVSATSINGVYWWISADGSTCNMETPGQFTDNGNGITMTIETPEIPLNDIQGWGRAYRMGIVGRYASPCCLTVSLAYDHDLTYIDQVQYNAYRDADVIGASPPFYTDQTGSRLIDEITTTGSIQFRLSRMPRQVMQTLRIKLQDSGFLGYYSSDGAYVPVAVAQAESCGISSIQIEYGQKAQLAKLSPSRTV